MFVFDFIGNLLGYVLWFAFDLTKNYGIAIIIFTIIIRLVLLPFSIKQQKSAASTAKLSAKQRDLQKKYGKDKQKYNEELTKLYQKEGVNPMGGCTTMLVPMILMFGVFYCVREPLQNILHIASDKVSQAVSLLSSIPVVGSNFNSYYSEIEIIRVFPQIRDLLTMFSADDIGNIEDFYRGFNFLGLDLLATPKDSPFMSFLWLIPLLSLLTSVIQTYIMQKNQAVQMQSQGCMKYSIYGMALFSAYIAYTVPAGVGFYWIISNVFVFGQTILLNKFYSHELVNAKREAARISLLIEQEKSVKRL